jgi:transcription elongation factor Elf1
MFSCRDCGYVTVVTSVKPTEAGPCLCGKCGGTTFTVQEKAA